MLTKTLLFQAQGGAPGLTGGDGGGDVSVLRAHDKKTGEVIHEIELDASPSGTPMSYAIGGRQYIALAIGGSERAEVIALALPRSAAEEAGQ